MSHNEYWSRRAVHLTNCIRRRSNKLAGGQQQINGMLFAIIKDDDLQSLINRRDHARTQLRVGG